MSYRNPDPAVVGCALLWQVTGGRLAYQIALERDATGNLRLHCTCADAVFRAEVEGRFCKHVHGLLAFGRRAGEHFAAQPAVPARAVLTGTAV